MPGGGDASKRSLLGLISALFGGASGALGASGGAALPAQGTLSQNTAPVQRYFEQYIAPFQALSGQSNQIPSPYQFVPPSTTGDQDDMARLFSQIYAAFFQGR